MTAIQSNLLSPFNYLKQELFHRSGRSVVTLVSIALVVFMAVTLTAISRASTDALRLPLENVGADIVVQLSGDIPQKLEGLVFSHPTAQLPAEIVEEIKKLPGVIQTSGAVFCRTYHQINFTLFWVLTQKVLPDSPG